MTSPPAAPRPFEHEQRYQALRAVSTIIRTLAIVVAVVGALGVVIGAVTTVGQLEGSGPSVLFLIGGLL